MRERVRPFVDLSPVEFLLERQRLGIGRYLKTRGRDPAEAQILKRLALRRMDRAERDDYLPLGPRRRLLRIGQ